MTMQYRAFTLLFEKEAEFIESKLITNDSQLSVNETFKMLMLNLNVYKENIKISLNLFLEDFFQNLKTEMNSKYLAKYQFDDQRQGKFSEQKNLLFSDEIRSIHILDSFKFSNQNSAKNQTSNFALDDSIKVYESNLKFNRSNSDKNIDTVRHDNSLDGDLAMQDDLQSFLKPNQMWGKNKKNKFNGKQKNVQFFQIKNEKLGQRASKQFAEFRKEKTKKTTTSKTVKKVSTTSKSNKSPFLEQKKPDCFKSQETNKELENTLKDPKCLMETMKININEVKVEPEVHRSSINFDIFNINNSEAEKSHDQLLINEEPKKETYSPMTELVFKEEKTKSKEKPDSKSINNFFTRKFNIKKKTKKKQRKKSSVSGILMRFESKKEKKNKSHQQKINKFTFIQPYMKSSNLSLTINRDKSIKLIGNKKKMIPRKFTTKSTPEEDIEFKTLESAALGNLADQVGFKSNPRQINLYHKTNNL